MTAARPPARPRMSRDELTALIRRRHLDFVPPELMVVGIRGYCRDGMGAVGENDRVMYDDAIFIVAADAFHAFNGNTDPNRSRIGAGAAAGQGWPA